MDLPFSSVSSKTTPMPASLRAFMAQLIDYAGLFPPASLPLEQAFPNYVRYRADPDGWMLGRFIIPASTLDALSVMAKTTLAEAADSDQPFLLSVLGSAGGATLEGFMTSLEADIEAIRRFQTQHGDGVRLEVFETKISVSEEISPLADLIVSADQLLTQHGLSMSVFYEVPSVGAVFAEDDGWSRRFAALIDAIVSNGVARVGVKVRCGGTMPAAFPSTAQIAAALLACAQQRVSLKATAGLHHPLRHFNAEVGAKMHGFLNVFGAGLMANYCQFDEAQLIAMLEDEDSPHFVFDDTGFAWQSYSVSADKIAAARDTLLTSYGSCSFDEPCDDLRALSLLP